MREHDEMAKNSIPIERWGRDHWTTLMYVETRCVDHRGVVNPQNMRRRDPRYPTRLANGMTVSDHDDFDCMRDAEEAGLVVWSGTGLNPRFSLTDEGWRIAGALRRWRAEGLSVEDFVALPAEGTSATPPSGERGSK